MNHDRWKHRPEIDWAWDLEDYPWGLLGNTYEAVYAFDIIEHVQRPVKFMEEVWRVSKNGAAVTIHTAWAGPHPDARAVWRDPTHVRPFHEESFHFFDEKNGGYWFSNYGKFYTPARFRLTKIQSEPPDCILFEMVSIKE